MSVSRRIFELWRAVQKAVPPLDVFRPEDVARLQSFPEYMGAVAALEHQTDSCHLAIVLALRSLAIQHNDLADRLSNTELVLTLPETVAAPARPTLYVIREMIESASREVILAGYRVTDTNILKMLHDAARRGVQTALLCGRANGDTEQIRASWPTDVQPPQLYQDVEAGESYPALMHIKALLVDASQLLISSANFTRGGMARNIEFGIQTDGQTAIEARAVLSKLIKSPLFEQVMFTGDAPLRSGAGDGA